MGSTGRYGHCNGAGRCRFTPVSLTPQRQQRPEFALDFFVGIKHGKIAFQPDGSSTTATASGSAPSASSANPILARARKAKAQMAKVAGRGGRAGGVNARAAGGRPGSRQADGSSRDGGDDGGGGGDDDAGGEPYWSEGTAETYTTQFMAVDGGGRPLVIQSMPNSRPYYPQRREGGRPANEEEAGNLAAVVRR